MRADFGERPRAVDAEHQVGIALLRHDVARGDPLEGDALDAEDRGDRLQVANSASCTAPSALAMSEEAVEHVGEAFPVVGVERGDARGVGVVAGDVALGEIEQPGDVAAPRSPAPRRCRGTRRPRRRVTTPSAFAILAESAMSATENATCRRVAGSPMPANSAAEPFEQRADRTGAALRHLADPLPDAHGTKLRRIGAACETSGAALGRDNFPLPDLPPCIRSSRSSALPSASSASSSSADRCRRRAPPSLFLDPMFVTAARAAISGLAGLGVLVVLRRPIPRGHAAAFSTLTLCLVLGFPVLSTVALTTVPSAHGGVILALLPLATAAPR